MIAKLVTPVAALHTMLPPFGTWLTVTLLNFAIAAILLLIADVTVTVIWSPATASEPLEGAAPDDRPEACDD